jgi:hypothetical protein
MATPAPAPVEMGKRRVTLRSAGLFLLGYALVAVAALPYLVSPIPRTVFGWVVLLLAAPPLYLIGEWAGEKLSADWGEKTVVRRVAKATLLVVAGLVLLLLNAALAVVFSGL